MTTPVAVVAIVVVLTKKILEVIFYVYRGTQGSERKYTTPARTRSTMITMTKTKTMMMIWPSSKMYKQKGSDTL